MLLCQQNPYGFSKSHLWMWELDHKVGWLLKNWCFQIVVLEKTLGSPLECKEIKPVNPKGNQLWIFIGRTDAETEAPILWPPDVKSWLIGKDLNEGKDWGQEEKGMTEDEMVRWPHRLNGHEFEWTLGVGDRQGGLVCCGPWGHKESDMTEWLNWTELKAKILENCEIISLCLTLSPSLHWAAQEYALYPIWICNYPPFLVFSKY